MSYSETVSEEEERSYNEEISVKKEPLAAVKAEHEDLSNLQVYTAIVLEEPHSNNHRNSSERGYNTRSKGGLKHFEVRSQRDFLDDDEEYCEDQELSNEDYYLSGEDDDVFVAQQVKSSPSSNTNGKEKKIANKGTLRVKDGTKRARKSALPWTTAESKTLSLLVNLYGAKEWQFVAKILQSKHNNNRTAAQCSQRWCRVINPSINKGPWDSKEDKLLIEKYDDLQGSWCKIVKFFPDRTDTQCKRRYEKILQLRSRMQAAPNY
jgi:hypothetical protein